MTTEPFRANAGADGNADPEKEGSLEGMDAKTESSRPVEGSVRETNAAHAMLDEARRRLAAFTDGRTCPFSDLRTPPPDVFAVLADHQISRHDLKLVAEEIGGRWPDVQEIACGLYHTNRPYVVIRIDSCTDENITSHAPLIEYLKHRLPRAQKFAVHFLPRRDPDLVSTDASVFQRAA